METDNHIKSFHSDLKKMTGINGQFTISDFFKSKEMKLILANKIKDIVKNFI